MKYYTLLYIVSALMICSCGQQNKSSNSDSADSLKKENKSAKTSDNIIHKIVPLAADFTNLISVSGANIVYTQGDYKMEVVGDSGLLQYLDADIESHVLTLSFASERNQDLSLYSGKINVTVNISAPDLQCVSLCSKGDFTTNGLWKGDNIQLGVLDAGQFHCDSIECNNFELQATGNGDAEFKHVKANKIHFANMSGCNVKADVDVDFLQCDNAGHSTISITGKANNRDMTPTKNGKIIFK